ncbi:hypothetical protein GCM10008090_23090 [Arenicella chitinivorans]|uniref:SH3b domain-containing protein n=1 Tax=Arenicella chitinivorans TaxID=1329800 RepID=A0A918VPN5_9GAMM|nr:SH3 domain-containing protein [Arenicella chitinivorans]GHA12560.1 hypothetical protein GCM10008090_23090 [Arenicella chitinivorans]
MVSVLLGIALTLSNAQAQNRQLPRTSADILQAEHQKELQKWTVKAYEGDPEAQFKVGVLYTNAQFSEPDFGQAVYWYKQAARQGHVLAQYNLGHQYLTGVGVKKSDVTAMQWWLKSAAQDHALSQFNIGRAYYLGIGLTKDLDESRRWFERAARNHEPKSIEILEQLGWAEPGQYTKQQDLPEPVVESTPTDVVAEERAYPVIPSRSDEFESVVQPLEEEPEPAPTKPAREVVTKTVRAPSSTPATKTPPASRVLTQQQRDVQTTTPGQMKSTETPPEVTRTSATKPPAPEVTPTTEPASDTSTESASSNTDHEIAVYTNPAIRSVLIGVLKQQETLEIVQRGAEWTSVRSRDGFPVWVSGDFVRTNGSTGTITGSAVNARSVPIIINGTVVGQLNKNESVKILGERGDWFRIMSPTRFIAWVKTSALRTRQKTGQNTDG